VSPAIPVATVQSARAQGEPGHVGSYSLVKALFRSAHAERGDRSACRVDGIARLTCTRLIVPIFPVIDFCDRVATKEIEV